MNDRFIPVTDTAAVDQLMEQSRTAPVLVFKHDPYCSISKVAYQQVAQLAADVPMIDVAHHNDVAQHIAARTGVKHESPQVILLRDGQAVWSASHYRITADAVRAASEERD